ncbi:MAG: TetR/AcrR family transcriptional regulator [Nocardioides sp.]
MTVEDIKAAAHEQLTQQSAGNVSLRAVAREVGLAPSAIYRYFESQTALVAAVAVDAYHSASQALGAARQRTRSCPARDQLEAVFTAYRRWALDNPAEFKLIFATDQSLLTVGPGGLPSATLHEFFATPVQIFVEGIANGQVDTGRAVLQLEARLTPEMEEVRATLLGLGDRSLSDHQIAVLLSAWCSVQGFVALEVFGQLGWFVVNPDELFAAHVRGVLSAAGMLTPEDPAAG